jgi:hypothetical protein
MLAIFDFYPENEDSSIVITASSADTNFPMSNLKTLEPVKSWKSNAITEQWVKYDFGGLVSYDNLFVNRINFAEFKVYVSTDDATYTLIEDVTGLSKDEIYDENYIHRMVQLTGSYRYLKIVIPAQTPLFEPTYFKIGNMLVGDGVELWNPKRGFSVDYIEKLAITEFKSNYITSEKLGRTKRTWTGDLDKVRKEKLDVLRLTYLPFVLYIDFDDDETMCYLVKNTRKKKSYHMKDVKNMTFTFEEIV